MRHRSGGKRSGGKLPGEAGRGGGYGGYLLVLLLLLLLLLQGCGTGAKQTDPAPQSPWRLGQMIDPKTLQSDLNRVLNQFLAQSIADATTASAATDDRALREYLLRWKVRVSDYIEALQELQDPRQTFLYTWIAAARFRYGVTEGEDRQTFADQQSRFEETARRFEIEMVHIAIKHFPESDVKAARNEIDGLARQRSGGPMRGDRSARPEVIEDVSRSGNVARLLSLPLAPFSGMQGVGEAPAAILQVAQEGRRAARIAANLPERTRWQLELLLYEIEDLKTVQDLREQVGRANQVAEQVAALGASLPTQVRQEVSALLEEVVALHPPLSAALQEARQTLALATDLSGELTRTAEAWTGTVGAAEQLLTQLGVDATKEKLDDATDPVTVGDIQNLLDRAVELATVVRGLAEDLDRTLAPEGPLEQALRSSEQTVDRSVRGVGVQAESLLDRAFYYALILLGAAFVFALLWTACWAWWVRHPRRTG